MPRRDLIVVGASAGGVETLRRLLSELPADLPAAVAIVLHVPSARSHALASILGRAGAMPVRDAADGMPITPGEAVIAPPDHHLLIREGRYRLSHGPKENGHRPCVDALFRSAARVAGSRTIGVVLSGALDDGAAGLSSITSRGGVGVVQDPDEAMFAGMPTAAIAHAHPDHVAPIEELAGILARLAGQEAPPMPTDDPESEKVTLARMEDEIAGMEAQPDEGRYLGTASDLSCPDCSGVLHTYEADGDVQRFRCVVGHAWSTDSLYAEQAESVETALWVAIRAIEERVGLARRMRDSALARGHDLTAQTFAERVRDEQQHAETLRQIIERGDLTQRRGDEARA